eukprot:RCo010392
MRGVKPARRRLLGPKKRKLPLQKGLCGVHGQQRLMMYLRRLPDGSYRCADTPLQRCQESANPRRQGKVMCLIHGRMRQMEHMRVRADGRYMCLDSDEHRCNPKKEESKYATCSLHGKKRLRKSLHRVEGELVCHSDDRCLKTEVYCAVHNLRRLPYYLKLGEDGLYRCTAEDPCKWDRSKYLSGAPLEARDPVALAALEGSSGAVPRLPAPPTEGAAATKAQTKRGRAEKPKKGEPSAGKEQAEPASASKASKKKTQRPAKKAEGTAKPKAKAGKG